MATSKTNLSWADRLASSLTQAAIEIGNFQVQLALGKAEARQEYEKLKKNLRNKLNTATGKVSQLSNKQLERLQKMRDELRVQLALGKAETRDEFIAQRKKILAAIAKLDAALSELTPDTDMWMTLRSEIEKARIKLDILMLHYRFSEMNATSTSARVAALKEKIGKMKNNAGLTEELAIVQKEINAAYDHLKKAFA